MPVYEYTCEACAHDFEQFVHTTKARVECPKCHGGKVTKRLSLFGAKTSPGTADPAPPAGNSGHG